MNATAAPTCSNMELRNSILRHQSICCGAVSDAPMQHTSCANKPIDPSSSGVGQPTQNKICFSGMRSSLWCLLDISTITLPAYVCSSSSSADRTVDGCVCDLMGNGRQNALCQLWLQAPLKAVINNHQIRL